MTKRKKQGKKHSQLSTVFCHFKFAFLYLIFLHLFEIYQFRSKCSELRLQMQEILLQQVSESNAKPKANSKNHKTVISLLQLY